MSEFQLYKKVKVEEISGRFLPAQKVTRFLKGTLAEAAIYNTGNSVGRQPVYGVRMGSGKTRVLMWSQMHGNETTTTKALLDLIRWLHLGSEGADEVLKTLTLFLIPVLNPDGADAYTRLNSNLVDLNRDAQAQSQPESHILRKIFEDFQPDFCFNLHDQRTIYGAGATPVPATLSFLSPSADSLRTYTDARITAAKLIGQIASTFRDEIGIGRYDDTFNPSCVGDNFQASGIPTLLFEAGHFPGDYQREITRYHAFRAIKGALSAIRTQSFHEVSLQKYLEIPENHTNFVDILIKNAQGLGLGYPDQSRLGIQYKEVLQGGRIHFLPELMHSGKLAASFGHREWDASVEEDLEQIKNTDAIYRLLG